MDIADTSASSEFTSEVCKVLQIDALSIPSGDLFDDTAHSKTLQTLGNIVTIHFLCDIIHSGHSQKIIK